MEKGKCTGSLFLGAGNGDVLLFREPLTTACASYARFELSRRGLSEDAIRAILAAPEQGFDLRPGRVVLQSSANPFNVDSTTNPFGGGNPFSPNSVTNPFSPTVWR